MPDPTTKLKKSLGLFDVYAISTGAMFSSGFFLLPGLAAAQSGPSVALAYLFAGALILPAMFSQAELATALPRAGGAYYFLDRSLGPLFGTIGGLGTHLALTLKTAFALIGIGAYAAIFVELPIKPVAIALTVAFVVINIVGAKESSGLQRVLVVILMTVLAFFLVQGAYYLLAVQPASATRMQFEPFLPFGYEGLLSTIGFVFVSYAGLTKVASVAEEIKDPERNIPLGMILSLASTTFVYVAGVFVMVAVLEPNAFRGDLTPVATAAQSFFYWLPGQVGVGLVVIAALAAFASTGNAGVLSASRYPLAMARDRLMPAVFGKLGRFQTPTPAILATGGLMVFFILVLDEEGIAKLASAFQLFIFALLCLAVIVMRESRIPSYDPGYRSPLYPWMQLAGILFSFLLILYMGWLAILFTMGVIVICLAWYYRYARNRVERDGAIYHWFRRLGASPYEGLDREFRAIMKEKGLRAKDPFDEVIAQSEFLDIEADMSFEDVMREASRLLSPRLGLPAEELEGKFLDGTRTGATPVAQGAALPHLHLKGIDSPVMVLGRSREGLEIGVVDAFGEAHGADRVHAVFILVSPEENHAQHLRMLAELANRIDEEEFIGHWIDAPNGAHAKELLMRDARFMTILLRSMDATAEMVGREVREVQWPEECLVAVVRRGGRTLVPRGGTKLEEGDRVTIIGEPIALSELRSKYPESS
ncbi:MAG: amino acid permease [Rhodothermales bacterium]|nr:amino acid permease [Rhodothermales bacterium]MBO6778628.1 amino acid permease [Rhodothermales bacterium]